MWLWFALSACKPGEGLEALDVAAGAWGFSCAVDLEGDATCWGAEDCDLPLPDECEAAPGLCPGASELLPPGRTTLVSVTAGSLHACGITDEGEVACWGSPLDGQAAEPAGNGWASVSAGAWHSCALADSGGITCWGDDGVGQASPPRRELDRTGRRLHPRLCPGRRGELLGQRRLRAVHAARCRGGLTRRWRRRHLRGHP